MTTVTINIPDNITTRVLNGFAKRYNYSPTLENGDPNPETKAQFCKRKIVELIKQAVREAEVEDASNTAATTAGSSADTDIQLS